MATIDSLCLKLHRWNKGLNDRIAKAQREVAEKIHSDVIDEAPLRSGDYLASIQLSDTKIRENTISTSVYSDLLVGGDNPKWSHVPLGCLLEWGTGIKGAMTNTYPHGYGYRMTPWVYYDEYLHQWVTTIGMIARPHFFPASQNNCKFR